MTLMKRISSFLMGAALVATAAAQPQPFANRVQTIRAGVLIVTRDRLPPELGKPANEPTTAAPYAFFNLDSNTNIKPSGWSFVNPSAPSRLVGDVYSRWSLISAQHGYNNLPVEGAKVTKDMAAYWEVLLNATPDEQLANYDVLLLAPDYRLALLPPEREKLRRFVDRGGILIIDTSALPVGNSPNSNAVDTFNPPPLAFKVKTEGNANITANFADPLLTTPYPINRLDVRKLTGQQVIVRSNANQFPGYAEESKLLRPVVTVNNQYRTLAVGKIGDGFVVVSTRGMATFLNGGSGLSIYAANSTPNVGGLVAAKLCVNAVSLAREFRQAGGGSRKSNSTFLSVPAPLLQRFSAPVGLGANAAKLPPVVYKGALFFSTNDRLVAYDANPDQDLDQDGNQDDGVPDYLLGQPGDRLWTSKQLEGPISAPACMDVVDDAGVYHDYVMVVDTRGQLNVFEAFNKNSNGVIDPLNTEDVTQAFQPPVDALGIVSTGDVPNAPVVHDGLIYVTVQVSKGAGNSGCIYVIDPKARDFYKTRVSPDDPPSSTPYILGANNSSPVTLPIFGASPTIGYIPILDNSGGVDKVVYAPTPTPSDGNTGPNNTAGIMSIWIGARGERPLDWEWDAGSQTLTVTTRAMQQGGLPIDLNSVRLSIFDNNGPYVANKMSGWDHAQAGGDGGILKFHWSGALPQGFFRANVKPAVRVDYDIEWGNATDSSLQNALRGQLAFSDFNGTSSEDNNRAVVGSLALSEKGTVFAVLSRNSDAGGGGTLYGFKEEGRGQFRCTLRYDLYRDHEIVMNQAVKTTWPSVVMDDDPVNQLLLGAGIIAPLPQSRILRTFSFRSGPTVRNGQVFVTATARKASPMIPQGFPVTVLMAFNSEPPTPEIPVGGIADGTTIVQPDFAKSTDDTTPEQQSILQSGNYNYDAVRGIIRIENLMNVNRGPIQSSISLSQPIILRQPNAPDKLIDPDAVGGRWSPLLWYTVIPGLQQTQSGDAGITPLIAGNTVFVPGSSVVSSLLTSGTLTPRGQLYAYDAEIPSNDEFMGASPERPYQKQLVQLRTAGSLKPNPHVRWPDLTGITDISEVGTRISQATLPYGTTAYGIIAGEGTAVAWGDAGMTSFSRSDFVVCDQGRVAVFDPSGNAIYSSNAFASSGTNNEGTAANVKPITRPTRAYAINGSELLIADAGGNQIARASLAGPVNRSITSFRLDPDHIPAGYSPNETLQLSGPRDVLTYAGYVRRTDTPLVSGQSEVEYWIHYLIADSGNRRLIEIIDRYRVDPATMLIGNPINIDTDGDGVGEAQLGVLLWHSPESVSGGSFEYNSITRTWVPDSTNPAGGRFVYVAGVGNSLPTAAGTGLDTPVADPSQIRTTASGNGGVVIFDPQDPKFVRVINQVILPDLSATKFYNENATIPADQWKTAIELADPVLINRRKNGIEHPHIFTGVNSVTTHLQPITDSSGTITGANLTVMVADATGVYEMIVPPDSEVGTATWLINEDSYTHIKPHDSNARGLRAMYARRLDSGEVLIVNGYTGTKRGGGTTPFLGEILQLAGDKYDPTAQNLGFDLASIRFQLGPIQGTRGLIQPIFADRR